jgi:hypothetical protein
MLEMSEARICGYSIVQLQNHFHGTREARLYNLCLTFDGNEVI